MIIKVELKVLKDLKNLGQKLTSNMPLFIICLLLAWFIITFLIYPNVNLLYETFFVDGSISFTAFERLFASERAMRSLRNSFVLAVSLVVTVNILGTFTVLATEYFDLKFAKILRLGYSTPLIYSGVVLVSGYHFVYGRSGMITNFLVSIFPNMDINWFSGYWAVLFVMTFACTTHHTIFLTNAIKKIDYQTVEAARSMGASNFTILSKVVLPVLKPSFLSITVLLFLVGLGAVSAPMIIGGQEFQTINPMIITFARSINTRDLAAALSLILGLATIIVLAITKKFEMNTNYMSVSKVKTKLVKQKIDNRFFNIVMHFLAYLAFVIYILPIMFIIIFSFTDGYSIANATLSWERFTFDNYIALFSQAGALSPYIVSLIYATLSSVIVVVIVLTVARLLHKYKKKFLILEYCMMIPWLLPSTLIAVGLMITYDRPHFLIGNNVLIGSYEMLLIGYIIISIPFALRMIRSAFYSIDDSLEEAAKSLGSGTLRTLLKVVFPTILPSILAVIALNFNSRLADFDLTVLLYHPLAEPLGITIMNSTDSSANINSRALMLVYSVVLMVISSLALYFVYGRKKDD